MEAASDHEQSPESPSIRLSKAVFALQSRLLDLPQCSESQLLAAGSLLSRRDYDDLVTERSLACVCGFPRCLNPVSAPRAQDRRFRISRRERRIYHLDDIGRFCSSSCCRSSTAFASTLLADTRTVGPTPSRVAAILALFHDNPPPSAPEDRGLAILEKTGPSAAAGEVTLDAWLGPADAVEGHVVPTRERSQASPKPPPGDISDLDDKMRRCSISPLAAEVSGELKSSLRKPGAGGEGKHGVKWADREKGSSSLGSSAAIAVVNQVELVAPQEEEDDGDNGGEVDAEAGAGGEGRHGVRRANEEMGSLSLGSVEATAAVNDEELEELPEDDDDGDNDSEEVETESEDDGLAYERCFLKWPTKPVPLGGAMFDAEDSWHDAPPEGFQLSLSTFATMWKALFGWMTCSSVAYIYGKSEDCRDEFLCINGREYPAKVTLSDGRSMEIKKTLAGCLARALPNVVYKLRLPMPVSTLEMAMGQLLETMMFLEALPPFSTKEWDVVVLLFLDALSISRVANLSSHMVNKKVLMDGILETAQIRRDEYETMKDLMIPLGRLPQFSVQSGA